MTQCFRSILLAVLLVWGAAARAQQSYDGQGSLNTHVQNMPSQQTPAWGPLQVSTPFKQPLPVLLSSQYPALSTPLAATATGTTGATTATMTGVAGRTMYVCGLSILSNATAAATAAATLSGILGGSLSFMQFTAPLASGMGATQVPFAPCLPASGQGVSIALASAAPGSGGNITVNIFGYYQ